MLDARNKSREKVKLNEEGGNKLITWLLEINRLSNLKIKHVLRNSC
jgi:hypothetical protein